jgi:histidyl-tRNA synthetase
MKSRTDILVLTRENNTADSVRQAADELREMGLNIAVNFSGRKIDKQFKTAMKTGVRYALFIDDEAGLAPPYILKDLRTGKEEKHSLQRIVSIVRDSRLPRER